MGTAIEVLQPQWVVIENVRGLLSSPAIRPITEGDDNAPRNPCAATPDDTALRALEPDPWHLGDSATRPLRAAGAVLGDLADLRMEARWVGLTPGSASSSWPSVKTLFRTPLASDSLRGGETLDKVKARRGTIALSHQIIDLALHGPDGSLSRHSDSATLWSLTEDIFTAGDAMPTPWLVGSTSPDESHQRPHS